MSTAERDLQRIGWRPFRPWPVPDADEPMEDDETVDAFDEARKDRKASVLETWFYEI